MNLRGNRLLRLLDLWCGVPLVFLLSLIKKKRKLPDRVEKIGILALINYGDFILSIGPTVLSLRDKFPLAHITVFTTKNNKSIISLLPRIDNIEFVSPFKCILKVRKYKFDVLIDYCPWPRIGAVASALARTQFTTGFSTRRQFRHYAYDRSVVHRSDVHEFYNNKALLQSVGCDDFSLPNIDRDIVKKLAPNVIPNTLSPYIIFHPWAAGVRKEMREWPNAYWCALATKVSKAGYNIIITGSRDDYDASEALISDFSSIKTNVYNACGKHSLVETSALILDCIAMISVNTGPMHLAAALHVPLIALNGPTNPIRWGPLSTKAVNISPTAGQYAYLDLGFEYPKHVKPCMQYILVEHVWCELSKMLL